ncbi:MAG TPA: hypothetical protein VNC39_12730 [Acidocella sp.]|jgi:hypothetical protein|uniref:hypothetical protein n=1 Tax=Acidocella sp. TaxID=50710 RepID=UPI002C480FEA|nr:hypothetical protein [Acidocella sp.]HVE22832.1 hypothetical protein [Acidocella sp.]
MNDMRKPVAVPAIGIVQCPDAALIALCAEHIANFHAYNDQASPDSKFEKDPLWHAYERTRDAICDAEPQTFAGMLAKARAAKVEATDLDGVVRPDGYSAAWAWDLLNDLIRINEGRHEPSPVPAQAGLSTAGMYQLIEQARDACTVLDEQQAEMPKNAHLERRLNGGHQRLLWEYQEHIARAASFLKPRDMGDVLAMLKLIDDKAEDLAANDQEEGFDFKAEMVALRRMVRGCLPIVAAELGVTLDEGLQGLCEVAFPEVPR